MIRTLTILGGDLRQTHLVRLLRDRGYPVACCSVPGLPDTHADLSDSVRSARALILPMPALDRTQIRGSLIDAADVLNAADPGAVIFGGKLDAFPKRGDLIFRDYAQDESLAILNAVPTAEAAIALAMEHMPRTLWGSQTLVIGWGRIGSALAQRLRLLGSHVTAASRSPAHRAACRTLDLRDDETGRYRYPLSEYDCIFNTVPCPVLSPDQLTAVRSDCPVLDLASLPGGLSPDCVRPENYIPALALPGKFFPATAAEILCDVIIRQLSELEEKL